MKEKKVLSLEEWKEKGKKIFGTDDYKEWKFVCPACKNIQSFKDFEGLVDDPLDVFYFSCIGRYKKGVGCDWTLGGLLQIHETEVTDREGENHPVMEFADRSSDKDKKKHPLHEVAQEK